MVTRAAIDEILGQHALALAGVSRDGKGFGNVVLKELESKGYEIHLVHPDVEELAGRPVSRHLRDVAPRVGAAILVTPPAVTEQLVREAAEAGIRRLWIQQGGESEAAIRFCEQQGLLVVHRECVLMFAEPAGWIHRGHRWVRGAFGRLPAA
jgi:predicted CoA-binding protein